MTHLRDKKGTAINKKKNKKKYVKVDVELYNEMVNVIENCNANSLSIYNTANTTFNSLQDAARVIKEYENMYKEIIEFIDKNINSIDVNNNEGLLIYKGKYVCFHKQKVLTKLTLDEVKLLCFIIETDGILNENYDLEGINNIKWGEINEYDITPDSFRKKVYRLKKKYKVINSIIKYRKERAVFVNEDRIKVLIK